MKTSRLIMMCLFAAVLMGALAGQSRDIGIEPPTTPPGEPTLEEPTMHSLGAWWIVPNGDGCRVEMSYVRSGLRPDASGAWRKGMPMFCVRPGDTTQKTHVAELNPPGSARLFAGSIVNLEPGAEYELRLRLVRPDGTTVEKSLRARTATEPVDPPDPRICHVVPGKGGGEGTEKDPYRGLDYAQTEARPGTIFLVHAGVYEGTFHVTRSGTPARPVIWRGAGDGETILDGGGTAKRVVEITNVHDVRLEKLSIRGAYMGIAVTGAERLVVRRCHISNVKCGLYAAPENPDQPLRNFFISDNVFDGPFTWGEGKAGAGTEEWRGIQISGIGHDICYNLIRGFKDGIDTFPSRYCSAIDIHHNDISDCKDDGIEMDFSERNNRCFMNRLTNVHQGISEQPIFGGPVYIFRNVIYNVGVEPFKLHHNGGANFPIDWWPSGAIFYHNTIIKRDEPFLVQTPAPVYRCVTRNNLFLGGGKRAMHFDPPMVECDFDYDGFGGGPWTIFMKWNGVFYKTFDEAKGKAPVQRHATVVDAATVFASGLRLPDDTKRRYDPATVDARLREGSAAVDAGEVLPGFNDGFAGRAPDLGAIELGSPLPHYGPRPVLP